jgi:hypothetical protein
MCILSKSLVLHLTLRPLSDPEVPMNDRCVPSFGDGLPVESSLTESGICTTRPRRTGRMFNNII